MYLFEKRTQLKRPCYCVKYEIKLSQLISCQLFKILTYLAYPTSKLLTAPVRLTHPHATANTRWHFIMNISLRESFVSRNYTRTNVVENSILLCVPRNFAKGYSISCLSVCLSVCRRLFHYLTMRL